MKLCLLCPVIMFILPLSLFSQNSLPIDPESGRVVIESKREVDVRSKKKKMQGMNAWVSKKLDYPPMVFSIIKSTRDTLMVKAITEVPTLKNLHPISFRLILVPKRKYFVFVASEFYFEDINLSLEKWLKKYGDSNNKRHQRNYELITSGLGSHIFMSMNNLAEQFKDKE